MAYTTINKPSDYFNTVTYTGNGTLATPITGVGFQPDLTWIKNRSAGEEQMWYDAVRGASKLLRCNGTDAEATTSTTVYFNSFDIDGFTVGTETALNANGQNIVAWNWKANGAGVSNTDGSITSTVSANTTAGFSIISYTGNGTGGATVGHGLGQKPACIIVKRRSASMNWGVYHQSLASNEILQLDVTNAVYAGSGVFNATQPTASVFYLGSGTAIDNDSGSTYIAYCFAEKKGFSKFGSYAGNNNADGTFVYTGFSPSFVLVKRYGGGTQNWVIYDNKRNTYNLTNSTLRPNLSASEATNNGVDLLSNGFKFRSNDGDSNGYSDGYIYMAFAENPLVGTNNIPACAR